MFKNNNKDTRTTPKVNNKDTRMSLLLTVTYFTLCSSVSIVIFEQVNAGWVTPETSIWARCNKILIFILLQVIRNWN